MPSPPGEVLRQLDLTGIDHRDFGRSDTRVNSADVRFGSEADIEARLFYARFTPKSGHCRATDVR